MNIIADRVKEQTTTVGTGTYSLDGAITGYQTFVSGIGDGASCYYIATDGTDWELGTGTVTDGTPDSITRDVIHESSNAGAAINWSAGNKNIFIVNPAKGIAGLAYTYIRNVSNTQDATAQTAVTGGVDTTLKLTGTGANNFSTFNVGTGKLEFDPTYNSSNGGVIVDQLDPQTELRCRLTIVNKGSPTSGVAKIFIVDDKTIPSGGDTIKSAPHEFRTDVEVPIEFSLYHDGIEALYVVINSDASRTYQVNGLKVTADEIGVGE